MGVSCCLLSSPREQRQGISRQKGIGKRGPWRRSAQGNGGLPSSRERIPYITLTVN